MATLIIIVVIFVIVYNVLFKLFGRKEHWFPQLLWYNQRIQADVRDKLDCQIEDGQLWLLKVAIIERVLLRLLIRLPFLSFFNTLGRILLTISLFLIVWPLLRIVQLLIWVFAIWVFAKIKLEWRSKNRLGWRSRSRLGWRSKSKLEWEAILDHNQYQTDITKLLILVCLVFFHAVFHSCGPLVLSIAEVLVHWRLAGLVTYAPAVVFFQRYRIYNQPVSMNRSFILLLLDYVEIILCFSTLYLCRPLIKATGFCQNILSDPFESIYFSVVTITTLGYGDFEPITRYGRFLVCYEVLIGLFFIVLIFGDFLQRSSRRFQT